MLRNHPLEVTLDLMSLYALSAAPSWLLSPVNAAIRYVTEARSAVDDESANESLSSMKLKSVPFVCYSSTA